MNLKEKMTFLGFGREATDSSSAVITLASANIGLAGVDKFLKDVDSWLHVAMSSAQLAVALVTIYYIWCKAKKLTEPAPRKKKQK